jgi:hypothetical protein
VTNVRERLVVSKQTTHRFPMDRLNLKKFSEVEVKKSNVLLKSQTSSQLWKTLDIEVDINSDWGTIREHQNFCQRES